MEIPRIGGDDMHCRFGEMQGKRNWQLPFWAVLFPYNLLPSYLLVRHLPPLQCTSSTCATRSV